MIFFGILWILPARTPKIKSSSGNAIAKIDYIKIGNVEQCVLIRSADINNPIILFLHGGPGMPMMYLAHKFQRPLEKHFTVVQWDRQGAGKTFVRNIPSIDNMNIRQQLDDCYELIDTLRHRYKKDRIYLTIGFWSIMIRYWLIKARVQASLLVEITSLLKMTISFIY